MEYIVRCVNHFDLKIWEFTEGLRIWLELLPFQAELIWVLRDELAITVFKYFTLDS